MKTFDDIKKILIEQNLSENCSFETQSVHDEFCKYTTVEQLDAKIRLLDNVSTIKDFSFFWINYNNISDIFEFNRILVKKENGDLTVTEERNKLVSWIKENNNKYILFYENTDSKIGYHFSFALPIIIKNF